VLPTQGPMACLHLLKQARHASSSAAVHRQLKKRAKLRPTNRRVRAREQEAQHALAEALPGLQILFENMHVCVISKPAGCDHEPPPSAFSSASSCLYLACIASLVSCLYC
jgi:23S rRNA-/tRNA-specific pseudouridylate synthase